MRPVQPQPTIAPELAELIDAVIVPALIARILAELRGISDESLQASCAFGRRSAQGCGEKQELIEVTVADSARWRERCTVAN